MNKNIDEIYMNIAQKLSDSMSKEWKEIKFNVELLPDVFGYDGEYISSDNKVRNLDVTLVNETIEDDFENLYQIMTEKSDIHKWNRAVFTLESNGNFSIDFEWDESLEDEMY